MLDITELWSLEGSFRVRFSDCGRDRIYTTKMHMRLTNVLHDEINVFSMQKKKGRTQTKMQLLYTLYPNFPIWTFTSTKSSNYPKSKFPHN